MCYDYSECGKCGKKTYCTTQCDEYCNEPCTEHRDCKSFNRCEACWEDLCDGCFEKFGFCSKHTANDVGKEGIPTSVVEAVLMILTEKDTKDVK